MIRRSFLKNYFIHSLKYLFDFSYFMVIAFFACITSGIIVFHNHLAWKNNIFSYQINYVQNLNFFNSCLIFILSFTSIFIISILMRFFSNMLFFNSKKTLQRGVALILTFIYTVICFNAIYKFGYSDFYTNMSGKTINFILVIFFIFSVFYYIIKNKLFNISQNKKYFILGFVVFSIGLFDWIIVDYSRNKIVDKIKDNEYSIVFYNSAESTQSITWSNLLITMNEKIKAGSSLFMNNFGDPTSYSFINKIYKYSGHVCKNDPESLNKYNLLTNIIPLTNLFPNRIAMELFPDVFCLNLGKNFSDVFLYGIYSNIMRSKLKNSNQVSFVNLAKYKVSSDELIREYEELFSSYPYVKEHTNFYFVH